VAFADEDSKLNCKLAEKWGWYLNYVVYSQDPIDDEKPEKCDKKKCKHREEMCDNDKQKCWRNKFKCLRS